MNGKKYHIIYADPPWEYKVWSAKGAGRTASHHYATMTLQDLRALPVQAISGDNAVLLMWATYPLLKDAIALGEAWGFVYKTVAFTWIKLNRKKPGYFTGMGHYTRANAELVLLFIKGKPLARKAKNIRQLVIEKRGRHSEKPHEVRKRIEQLFGDVPRLEMFARSNMGIFPDPRFDGWEVFGNEVTGSITLKAPDER